MNTPLSDKTRAVLARLLAIDYAAAARAIQEFIRNSVEEAGARGAVLGVSGGVDSSTALVLTARALGASRVHALLMPDREATPRRDIEDALWLIDKLGVGHDLIYINDIVDAVARSAPWSSGASRVALGNVKARIRAVLLYFYANTHNYLVVGTGDRSEILIGYFTKYGDGAVDILPIGCLYKTQVRRLAVELGVPEDIAYKPSSPRLWKGHEAEKELGISYEVIDAVLYALFDKGLGPDEAAEYTGVERSIVDRILGMHRASRHKRRTPPIPSLPWLKQPVSEI